MLVNRAKIPTDIQVVVNKWRALPPLGPYYAKDYWFIERESGGTFNPVVNRTPAQAAAARLMLRQQNPETYAAALTGEEVDESVITE
jgi:hypothetical protein